MTLAEIINTNNWLSVGTILLQLYPDQEENMQAYDRIYHSLQKVDAINSATEIVIEQSYDEEMQSIGAANVYGIDYASQDELTNAVALEFTPWNQWLGMGISELTQKEFTELEIIAHCLYEMTFVGYNEEEIQEEFARIKGIYDEYKSLTPEQKKDRTKSLDDLLKDTDEEA